MSRTLSFLLVLGFGLLVSNEAVAQSPGWMKDATFGSVLRPKAGAPGKYTSVSGYLIPGPAAPPADDPVPPLMGMVPQNLMQYDDGDWVPVTGWVAKKHVPAAPTPTVVPVYTPVPMFGNCGHCCGGGRSTSINNIDVNVIVNQSTVIPFQQGYPEYCSCHSGRRRISRYYRHSSGRTFYLCPNTGGIRYFN